MNPVQKLAKLGQSIWYDNIQRSMLNSGELADRVAQEGLRGVTSNPTIFEKAIAGSNDYDEALETVVAQHPEWSTQDVFFYLAIQDIQEAADILYPVYDKTGGMDGMISLEVSPTIAHDTKQTIFEARKLWGQVHRANLMIKVPATKESLPAIETLTADGINLNITLLFSVDRYEEVLNAYLNGLESRIERGLSIENIASVASFFVSRVDGAIDKQLTARLASASKEDKKTIESMLGKVAIANAKLAYDASKKVYSSDRYAKLNDAGANKQRLLWASTGVKNPDYRDVLYIEALVGPDTVNTVPPATYEAYLDHGEAEQTLEEGVEAAYKTVAQLEELGIDLKSITDTLEEDGIVSFAKSFEDLLNALDEKKESIASSEELLVSA